MLFACGCAKHNAYVIDMQVAYPCRMKKAESYRRKQRRALLKYLIDNGTTAAQMAADVGTPASYLSAILSGDRGLGDGVAQKIEKHYSLGDGWFDRNYGAVGDDGEENPDADIAVVPGGPETPGTGIIALYDAKGSCGGGRMNFDGSEKTPLIKEDRWFVKYGVRPHQVFAIYADGDSMADFIVDGDIVIFNSAITTLGSNQIYAIDTYDGLRIKRVHKRSDGTVVLASDNLNKSKFPDEAYSPDQAQSLQVKGKFVYRQGG